MHANHFDTIARRLAAPATRRVSLRLLAGGLLGALFTQHGAAPARATQPQQPCAEAGLTDCLDVCVDVASDPANCGYCGNGCAAETTCLGGWCQSLVMADTDIIGGLDTCALQGLTDCGEACVDIEIDVNNCGGCGVVCGGSAGCFGGMCLAPPVPACSSTAKADCGGVCVYLNSDPNHCGACFNSCPLGGYCQGGICTGLNCLDGLTDCYGHCVDTTSDWSNCGGCGLGCFAGTTCQNGACN